MFRSLVRNQFNLCAATRNNGLFVRNLSVSDLTIKKIDNPGKVTNEKDLKFGQSFSDHMLQIKWDIDNGWNAPEIKPLENLSLHPAASVLHYALECFEGMKAYKATDGTPLLFRPDRNMARMATSSQRLCFPEFDQKLFLDCLSELVKLDKQWIPSTPGYSLYIRPTFIATTPWLGVGPTTQALFYVICSPVGPYYPSGFKPVQLYAESKRVRAAEGGTGAYKIGGNYAPTILPQVEAAKKNYSQVLWLYGKDHEMTEVGTMNLFMYWINEQGEKELITAPLDGTILPGVTRDSILEMAREWGEFKVTERKWYMGEVLKAQKEGRIIEMFGAGTAVVVSPIDLICFEGKDYAIPLDADDSSAAAGKLTNRFFERITSIQYGKEEHPWSVRLE